MKRLNCFRGTACLAIALAGCVLLSSCGFVGDYFSEEDIKKVVTSYLKNMTNGTFAIQEYKSDKATDTSFANLKFKDESAKEIMNEGFLRMTYVIGDCIGSKEDELGSCHVTITSLDIDKVISDNKKSNPNAESMMAACTAAQAPIIEYEVVLMLHYKSGMNSWQVSNASELVARIGQPYADMIFPSPQDAVEASLLALISDDPGTFAINSFESEVFFPEDDSMKEYNMALFSGMTYEIVSDPIEVGLHEELNVSLTLPDIQTIETELIKDVDFMALVIKPITIAYLNEEDISDELIKEVNSNYMKEFALAIQKPDVPTITKECTFDLLRLCATESWRVKEMNVKYFFPESFDYVTLYMSDEDYLVILLRSAELLYAEGEIDQYTYDVAVWAFSP